MKAHIERSPAWMNKVEIVLYDTDLYGAMRVYQWHGDKWSFESVKEGEPVPRPTIELAPEMLEAIVAAAGDILPPSAATDRHLKDALAVRDRLLTLVER